MKVVAESSLLARCRSVTRRTSTQWYIGAWIAWMGAMLGFLVAYRNTDTLAVAWFQNPNLTGIAAIVEVSMLVMFVAWIGALVRLAKRHEWRWFAVILVTQLLGAGIAGMVSYAGNGPEDLEVTRRQVT